MLWSRGNTIRSTHCKVLSFSSGQGRGWVEWQAGGKGRAVVPSEGVTCAGQTQEGGVQGMCWRGDRAVSDWMLGVRKRLRADERVGGQAKGGSLGVS